MDKVEDNATGERKQENGAVKNNNKGGHMMEITEKVKEEEEVRFFSSLFLERLTNFFK